MRTPIPVFVAADLLSQAEHGADSQVIMLTDSRVMIEMVKIEAERQAALLERSSIALQALENSSMILLDSLDECLQGQQPVCPRTSYPRHCRPIPPCCSGH